MLKTAWEETAISDQSSPNLTQFLVTWVHRITITNTAFWVAALSMGFVLGVVPAQSVLLQEVRAWRQSPNPPLGILNRMLRGAWRQFVLGLIGSFAFCSAVALLVGLNLIPTDVIVTTGAIILATWAFLIAMHVAWRQSWKIVSLHALNVSQHASKWTLQVEFLACAWLHLVGAIIWIGAILLTPIQLLPLLFFLPATVAFVIVSLESSAYAIFQHSR